MPWAFLQHKMHTVVLSVQSRQRQTGRPTPHLEQGTGLMGGRTPHAVGPAFISNIRCR